MKVYIYVTIAIILIAGIAISSSVWLNVSSTRISNGILPLAEAVNQEDWDKANLKLEELKNIWHKNSQIWHVIIDHEQIINIEVPMEKLSYYVEHQEKQEAGKNIVEVQYWLEYIRKMEKINLNNIF